jgi:hypothetical protein
LPHFVFSFPMKTIISSVHFIATIIIRRSVLCTLRVTCRFHITSIGFRPVIDAVIIIYIIRRHQCTDTLGVLCVTSVYS